jgi:hypothetical protein
MFPACGTCTTRGMVKDFKEYAGEKKLLTLLQTSICHQIKSNIKKIKKSISYNVHLITKWDYVYITACPATW